MYAIEIKHNCEAAHRLAHPDAPKKCRSIHGHSWMVTVRIESARVDQLGLTIEFGVFKKAWRELLDTEFDHALWLESGDGLIQLLASVEGQRVKEIPCAPTTENMARLFAQLAGEVLERLRREGATRLGDDVRVAGVHVQETRVNAAAYTLRVEGV